MLIETETHHHPTAKTQKKTTSKLLDWFSVAIFFGFRLIEIIISQSKPIEISVIHTNDPWAEQPKTNCLAKCMVHIGTTKRRRRNNNNNNNEKQILLCALYNNCFQMGRKISKRSQIICKCVCVFVIKFQYFLEDQTRPYLQSASESLQLQCVQAKGAVAADGRAGARALMVSLMRRRVLVDGFQRGMAVCLSVYWLDSTLGLRRPSDRLAGWLAGWSGLCVWAAEL